MNHRSKDNNSSHDHLVVGRHAIAAVLSFSPQRIKRALILKGSRDERGDDLFYQLRNLKIDLQEVSEEKLTSLSGTTAHQGMIIEVTPPPSLSLDEIIDGMEGSGGLLLLDSIFDPHNFGTLLRAAECFGLKGVVWSKNRGSGLTPTATKASVGASELIPLCEVSNLAQAIRTLKNKGVWIVVSALSADAIPLPKLDLPEPWALVVGSEGEGVSRLVGDLSDYIVSIPMYGMTQSLNVSQATSVLLYEITKEKI